MHTYRPGRAGASGPPVGSSAPLCTEYTHLRAPTQTARCIPARTRTGRPRTPRPARSGTSHTETCHMRSGLVLAARAWVTPGHPLTSHRSSSSILAHRGYKTMSPCLRAPRDQATIRPGTHTSPPSRTLREMCSLQDTPPDCRPLLPEVGLLTRHTLTQTLIPGLDRAHLDSTSWRHTPCTHSQRLDCRMSLQDICSRMPRWRSPVGREVGVRAQETTAWTCVGAGLCASPPSSPSPRCMPPARGCCPSGNNRAGHTAHTRPTVGSRACQARKNTPWPSPGRGRRALQAH